MKIRNLQNEIKDLQENTEEKDYQIRDLNKGMEAGNAHVRELQDELNDYKQKFYNLDVKENKAKQRIQDLQQELQRRDSSTEVKELRLHIQEIETEKNVYLERIQQKENELKEIKQSAVKEHNEILKANRQEIMNIGNAEHNRILTEKNKEMHDLKEKYSELKKQFIELKEEYDYVGERFDKQVNKAANNKAMLMSYEKDQEIQRLQEQLNQFLSQQGAQKTEMEEEAPKIEPERIEIEEKKEEIIPRQGMQTRSQGPSSFGEKIQQEEYDPLGNLTWKGTVYDIANWGNFKAYDVILKLISPGNKSTGSRIILLNTQERKKMI